MFSYKKNPEDQMTTRPPDIYTKCPYTSSVTQADEFIIP